MGTGTGTEGQKEEDSGRTLAETQEERDRGTWTEARAWTDRKGQEHRDRDQNSVTTIEEL